MDVRLRGKRRRGISLCTIKNAFAYERRPKTVSFAGNMNRGDWFILGIMAVALAYIGFHILLWIDQGRLIETWVPEDRKAPGSETLEIGLGRELQTPMVYRPGTQSYQIHPESWLQAHLGARRGTTAAADGSSPSVATETQAGRGERWELSSRETPEGGGEPWPGIGGLGRIGSPESHSKAWGTQAQLSKGSRLEAFPEELRDRPLVSADEETEPAPHQILLGNPCSSGQVLYGLPGARACVPSEIALGMFEIIDCENKKWDPRAISATGDYGLMQLSKRYQSGRAERLGYEWNRMLEVGPNIAVAVDLWQDWGGWHGWTCGR